jgi:hypothetical protein
MRASRLAVGLALTLGAAVALVVGATTGGAGDASMQSRYESHYLVFGTRGASGAPRLLAIDFNRTTHGPDRVAYEYKLFVGRGGEWSMPVYETWEATPDGGAFPARGGLCPLVAEDGSLQRVQVDVPDLSLEIEPGESSFPFPEDAAGDGGTGHPNMTVTWNGTTYEGPGVYEWISAGGDDASETPERTRQLDDTATFGLYDYIVLYDDSGRLWHISQGTLTPDFAYQNAVPALPAETDDVLVRWLATEPDPTARMHSPTRWLVDVPAWRMCVRLRKTGEHRGHGPVRPDSTRPIYVQAGVQGRGLIRGEEHRFFGMVEHIRD